MNSLLLTLMTSIGADKQGMDAVNKSSLNRLDLSLQRHVNVHLNCRYFDLIQLYKELSEGFFQVSRQSSIHLYVPSAYSSISVSY
jgi:hypothetical protein